MPPRFDVYYCSRILFGKIHQISFNKIPLFEKKNPGNSVYKIQNLNRSISCNIPDTKATTLVFTKLEGNSLKLRNITTQSVL